MYTYKFFYPLSTVVIIFASLLLLLSCTVHAHGNEEHNDLPTKVNVCHSLTETDIGACYRALCDDISADVCAEDIVDASLSGSGPTFAAAVLNDLSTIPHFDSLDTYALARRIGHLTAEKYGTTGEAFLRCSNDFRYGCPYGFFEKALQEEEDISYVTSRVCDSLSNPASHEKCYHRIGHVLMKNSGHSLNAALQTCDTFTERVRSHCFDGVFMEGVHEVLADGTVEGFNGSDALSPCNQVDGKYQKQCYGNHGPYLLKRFNESHDDALQACADAGTYISICKESITSGGHHHDMHTEQTMKEDNHTPDTTDRSWFRRLIDFIVSLFTGSGNDDMTHHTPGHSMDISGSEDMHGSATHRKQEQTVRKDGVALSKQFPDGTNTEEADAVIVYRDNAYTPKTVRISAGQTVLWVNESSVFWPAANKHPTHKEYPGSDILKCHTDSRENIFDACKAMGPGAGYSFTFHEHGEWKYHDHINPQAGGVIIVE